MSATDLPKKIAISFHLQEDDLNSQAVPVKLQALLEKQFAGSDLKTTFDTHNSEAIFECHLPLVTTDETLSDLFRRLNIVLNSTGRYSPHFTQPTS